MSRTGFSLSSFGFFEVWHISNKDTPKPFLLATRRAATVNKKLVSSVLETRRQLGPDLHIAAS
jgi:hypothetical protein